MSEGGLLESRSVDIANLPYGSYKYASNVTDTICIGFGDETKIDPEHNLVFSGHKMCDKKLSVGGTLLGTTSGFSHVCRKCTCNLHNALCNRHLAKRPKPTRSYVHAIPIFESLVPELTALYLASDASRENWLKKWPECKRLRLLQSETMDILKPDRVDCMVKREGNHSMPSKARAIQMYPNDLTKMLSGPACYALQKATCKLFQNKRVADGIRVTFASGMNSVALGDWMKKVLDTFACPVFYERDGKNWDSTMNRQNHDLKMLLYKAAGPEFCQAIEDSYRVRGHYRGDFGFIRYTVNGTTRSGHNDTTLGNSIINAAIAIETMVALGLKGSIIVAGDDLVVAIEGDFDEQAFNDYERSLGIIPESRKFTNWRDVSFISGIWYLSEAETISFIPKPGRLLARLFWTTSPPSRRRYNDYMHSIVAGLRPACGSIPVISTFLEHHDRQGKIISVGKDFTLTSTTVTCSSEVVLEEFCRRYGCDRDEIASLESAIRRSTGPSLLVHPLIDKINEVDLADISDRRLTG